MRAGSGARGWLLFIAVACLVPAGAIFADDDVRIGGDVRARTEYKRPFNYVVADGGEPTGDDVSSIRTRLHFHWQPSEAVEVVLQAQDARVWGIDSVGDNADPDTDLKQGYIQLNNLQDQNGFGWLGSSNDVDVKIGRMNLPTFGDGYIIAANDWETVSPIAFEGFWIDGEFGGEDFQVDVDVLWMDFANANPLNGGAIGPAEDTAFYGLQVGSDDLPWVGGEAYYWVINRPKSVDEQIFGGRLYTQMPEDNFLADLFVVFEYALASGERGAQDVDANFWVVRGEYDFELFDLPHTVGVGFSHATGSPNAASDNETWVSPFDLDHDHLGHYDLVANSNVDDFFITFKVSPTDTIDLHLDFHMFSLDEEEGGWSTLSAGTVAAGGTITDDDLGTEVDFYAVCQVFGENELRFGYSNFQPGDAIEDATGGFDDAGDFFYLQVTVPFGTEEP